MTSVGQAQTPAGRQEDSPGQTQEDSEVGCASGQRGSETSDHHMARRGDSERCVTVRRQPRSVGGWEQQTVHDSGAKRVHGLGRLCAKCDCGTCNSNVWEAERLLAL